jgi:hypothetical protein
MDNGPMVGDGRQSVATTSHRVRRSPPTSVANTAEREECMARIEGVDPNEVDEPIAAVLQSQARKWGGPLLNHLLYARRPSIFRGARGMWGGLDASGLIDPKLAALVNRRVAMLNRCAF